MMNVKISLLILCCILGFTSTTNARELGQIPPTNLLDPYAQTLDGQAKSLQKTLIGLSQELVQLENELLFPGNTQIAVYLSLRADNINELKSIQLSIDDSEVSNYVYSAAEKEAIAHGSVHRVYLGNLSEGKHHLVATVDGRDNQGKDYHQQATLHFKKDVPPKFIELKIVHVSHTPTPRFVAKEWQ